MKTTTAYDAKEVVTSFLNAMNNEDYGMAKRYVNDDMIFTGVLGTRDGAEAYFKDMERMRFHYDIIKVFADDDDVCVLYDINMSGKTIFTCGWYHVSDGQIDSLRVVFDPRPVL